MKKKRTVTIAAVLALVLIVGGAISVMAASGVPGSGGSKYDSADINKVTGQGQEPEDISVSAAAGYAEKEWYEYVAYSEDPVSSYKLNDNNRLIFYDPYDYNSSMVMDVTYDKDNGWSTADSISISHTFSKSMEFGKVEETTQTSAREHALGPDYTSSTVKNSGIDLTTYNHQEKTNYDLTTNNEGMDWVIYNSGETHNFKHKTTDSNWNINIGISGSLGEAAKGSIGGGGGHNWGYTESIYDTTHKTGFDQTKYFSQSKEYGDTTTNVTGEDIVINQSESATVGWTTVADRVTASTGTSIATNSRWSTEESTTITKTFDSAYFNSSGAPLSWTIAYYEVKMPMKVDYQVRVNNDWITTGTGYCELTTIEGACRAWRENTVTYYEHWGTGEPIADSDFWKQYFTKEKLVEAYKNKLYPDK